jgi:trk system potassium uptake protein TrkH
MIVSCSVLWSTDERKRESLLRRLSPPQLFVGSFLLLILIGTLALKVLPNLYTGERLSWLDALFTSTSAVCVTGLIVVDTATYFTPIGQALILALIQLGGLGIITFTTVIIIALGRRLSLRHEVLVSDITEVVPRVDYRHLVRNVLVFTFLFELGGALLLYGAWLPEMGWAAAAWPALFHSISAFCNAGFSVFSDSLVGFQRAPLVQFVVMALIVLGGVGFLTLEELYLLKRARREGRRFRLSLHSRIVIVTTAVLVFGGWIFFTAFEWTVAFKGEPVWAKVMNGLFASVTARTAGFNTIDYSQTTERTNFLTILLMSIGGSPGSTAGGIKTTTFALIVILAWSRFRGREVTSLWGRTVPGETVQRAIGLAVVAFGLVTVSIFALTATELGNLPHSQSGGGFLKYMFEATSAFNTVGLSMGVTADLSAPGRWIVTFLMFVGRVGPLTFAAALASQRRRPLKGFRDAYEDVVVG